MDNLYKNQLAKVYDTVYQGFIDYEEEFDFYSTLCKKYGVRSIIELACGSGHLAKKFSKSFDTYLGVDISEDMLKLAKAKTDPTLFAVGDMRNFKTLKKFDAVLITGRSTSYLTTQVDFLRTLKNSSAILNNYGILIFDCIDGEKFIPYIKKHPYVIHKATVGNRRYYRESNWKSNPPAEEKLVAWDSKYYEISKGQSRLIGEDHTVFKVFRINEIERFLIECNYQLLKIVKRKTYAFDTFVIIAKKIVRPN